LYIVTCPYGMRLQCVCACVCVRVRARARVKFVPFILHGSTYAVKWRFSVLMALRNWFPTMFWCLSRSVWLLCCMRLSLGLHHIQRHCLISYFTSQRDTVEM
jgi:hypothetical protein